jgi:hypothetical protein
VLSGFFHLPAFEDALANMRSFLTSNVVPHEHRDDTRWIRKHVRVFSVFDRRAHLKWIEHVSYNDYGYNPYDEPDYSSHPNSDFISRSDDTGDGVVGGYYWSDSGSWVSLPDDRDYGGGGYAPARKKPEPEPTPGLRETSTKLAGGLVYLLYMVGFYAVAGSLGFWVLTGFNMWPWEFISEFLG